MFGPTRGARDRRGPRSTPTPPPEFDATALQDLAVVLLVRRLAEAGIAAQRRGRRVGIGTTGVVCELRLIDVSRTGLVFEYRIVHPLDPRPIVQALVWFGRDVAECVAQIVAVLVRGVLAPLLAAYDVSMADTQVATARVDRVCADERSRVGWSVFVGDPLVFGTSSSHVHATDRTVRRSHALLRPLEAGIGRLMDHRDECGRPTFHWWKVMLGRSSAGKQWGDAWLDERQCDETFRRVAALETPDCRLLLLRQFGVMRPDLTPDHSLVGKWPVTDPG